MREKCNVTGDEMELATSLSASEFRDHHQCINLEFASNSFFFCGWVGGGGGGVCTCSNFKIITQQANK